MNAAAPEFVRTIIAFRSNKQFRARSGVEEEAKAI